MFPLFALGDRRDRTPVAEHKSFIGPIVAPGKTTALNPLDTEGKFCYERRDGGAAYPVNLLTCNKSVKDSIERSVYRAPVNPHHPRSLERSFFYASLACRSALSNSLLGLVGGLGARRFPKGCPPPIGSTIAAVFAPVVAAIRGSELVAMIDGEGDRWSTMHAPAPRIVRVGRALVQPVMRYGSRVAAPLPVRMGAIHDPCAMRATMPTALPRVGVRTTAIFFGHCPVGYSGVYPHCYPPVTKCPLGEIGTLPYCHPIATPTPIPATPTPLPMATATPVPAPVSRPGINRWWTYEEGALPSVGKWMVNVGSGNLVVRADRVAGRFIQYTVRYGAGPTSIFLPGATLPPPPWAPGSAIDVDREFSVLRPEGP